MKAILDLRVGLILLTACLLAGFIAQVEARQASQKGSAPQNSSDISDVVTGSKGPEAGV
jgi:hypothetical protein